MAKKKTTDNDSKAPDVTTEDLIEKLAAELNELIGVVAGVMLRVKSLEENVAALSKRLDTLF